MASIFLVFISLVVSTTASNADITIGLDQEVEALKGQFYRSEQEHVSSMDAIGQNMTAASALEILSRNKQTTPALKALVQTAFSLDEDDNGVVQLSRLRAGAKAPPKGYSGVDKARHMLNEMLYESMEKYDLEIIKCTNYYSRQCGLLEACRGEISAANYKAAHSRQLILGAQTQISISRVNLPRLSMELKQHNMKCKHETHALETRLQVVLADIEVMTSILKMTDCDAKKKSLLQDGVTSKLGLMKCKGKCGHFVTFQDGGLRKQIGQLKSESAKQLLDDSFNDMSSDGSADASGADEGDGSDSDEVEEFLQEGDWQTPIVKKAGFNNPPVPRTEVPGNPCTDPNQGAPSASDKRAAKCSINAMPKCYKLQERFLLIQSGIMDERDSLKENLEQLTNFCKETKLTLETDISNEETMLKEEGTKLAEATTEESNAGEKARLVAQQNDELAAELRTMMKGCSKNYINFETEQCGLKKIRGELYKMKGGGHSAFFQDCKVTKWEPDECSKSCGHGKQSVTRSIMTKPDGGADCLPLTAMKNCNDSPCPVDCRLETWTGWSRCSAECGGGVTQRVRDIKVNMKHEGKPCGETSESKACNVQACEKDCDLSEWTKWSPCSKACDGGSKKRQKFVKNKALGAGHCQDAWSTQRLEYKKCGMQRCVKNTTVSETLKCGNKMDVILVMDGSGSLKQRGWDASVKAAKMFVKAFVGSADANIAILLFSGPRTWSGVEKCIGSYKGKVDLEKTCKIKWVSHFTPDIAGLIPKIDALVWPKGGTLTSLALGTAAAELSLSRKSAPATVVVITDGRPLSFKKTKDASRNLRKSARLIWVPVTKFAPLASIKKWATRRWQENIVQVGSFAKLATAKTMDELVADMCKKVE